MAELGLPSEAELTDEQFATLREVGELRTVSVGDVLYRAGDEGFPFIAILDAEVEIVGGTLEQEIVVVTHGSRRFLGELGLLTDERSRLTARVSRAGQIIAVPRTELRRLMAGDSEFGDIVLAAFMDRRHLLRDGAGANSIQVIGSRFSSQTQDLRAFLIRSGLPHLWVDLDAEKDAEGLLARYGGRPTEIPVVVTSVGVLRQPTPGELADLLGLTFRPMPGHIFDLVVIGAGPAGLAASVYGASEGLSTVTLDAVAVGGQASGSSRIENYLGFPQGLSGLELTERATIQAERFGARIASPCAAVGMRTDDGFHVVTLVDGSEVPARAVIVASGAEYRRPGLAGWEAREGNGVYYATTLTEAGLCAGSPVVVLGGGNSAGQAALFLAGKGCPVHIVIRGPDLGRSMSRYLVTRIEADDRIDVLTDTELASLEGEGRLDGVVVRSKVDGNTDDLKAVAVFCFIGADPATSWLSGDIAVDEDGFIRTDRDLTAADLGSAWEHLDRTPLSLETSLPGVFAAGDVRSGSVKRVAAAVGEGSTAVRSVHQYLAIVG
ncbi:MAG: thioredoxin reductase [Frankiales bacterium]|nr:thioredoxin reductase [Frankiales bacterium]